MIITRGFFRVDDYPYNLGLIHILHIFPTDKVHTFIFDKQGKILLGKECQNGEDVGRRGLCMNNMARVDHL